MLDGALTMGSADAAHIRWRTPQEVFNVRLQADIARRVRRYGEKQQDVEADLIQQIAIVSEQEVRMERSKHFNGII